MELALLITTPGFVHIFEEIVNQMDSKSLFTSCLVCKDWWKVIQNHPQRWRKFIRRIRIKEAIIHPDFHGIMKGVEAKKGLKELCLVLRQFSEDKPRIGILNQILNRLSLVKPYGAKYLGLDSPEFGMNMRDFGFFKLVFGDLKRLQYFWPYLPNKNPVFISDKFSTLHILAKLGDVEIFQFIAERLDEVTPYRSMSVKDQLDIASQKEHFGMVQIIGDKLQNPN